MPCRGGRARPLAALFLLVLVTSEYVCGSVQRSGEHSKLREVLNKALNERSVAIAKDNLESYLEPTAFKEARTFDKKQLEFWNVLDRFGSLTKAEDEFLRETDRLFNAGGSDPVGLMAKVIASRGRVRELFKQSGKGNDDESVRVGVQSDGSSVPFDPVEMLEVESKTVSMSREKAMAMTRMDPLSAQLVFFFAALAVKLLVKVVTSTIRKYYEHKERLRNMRFMRCANLMSSYAALRRVHPLIRLLAGVREASRRDSETSNKSQGVKDTDEFSSENVAEKKLADQWKEIQGLEKLIVQQLFEHESKMRLSTICEDQGAVNAIMDNMFMDRIEEAFDRRKLRFDPYDQDPGVADLKVKDILKGGDVRQKDVENNLRPGANVFLETEEKGDGLSLFPTEMSSSMIPEMPNYFGWYMVDLLQSLMVAGFERVFTAIWNGVEKKELAVLCQSYALRYRNTYMARLLLRTVKKFAVMTELTGELSNPIPVPKSLFHKMCEDINCEKLGFKLGERELQRLKKNSQWGTSPKASGESNARRRASTSNAPVAQGVEPAPSVASSKDLNTVDWYSSLDTHNTRHTEMDGGELFLGADWRSERSEPFDDETSVPHSSPVHSDGLVEEETGRKKDDDDHPPNFETAVPKVKIYPMSDGALRRKEEMEKQVDTHYSPMMHKYLVSQFGEEEAAKSVDKGFHGAKEKTGHDEEQKDQNPKGGSAIFPFEESEEKGTERRPYRRSKSMTALDDIDKDRDARKQFLFNKLHLETHAESISHDKAESDAKEHEDGTFNPLIEDIDDIVPDVPDMPVRQISDVKFQHLKKWRAALYRHRVLHLHERTNIKNDFLAKVRRIAVLWLSANYQQGGEYRQNKCVTDLCYANIGTLNGKEYFECRTLCALAGLLHSSSDVDLTVLDLKTYQQIVLYATQIIEKENDAQDILNHYSEACNNPVGAVQLGFESRVFDRFQASVEAGSAIIQQCNLFSFFMMQLHVRAAQCYENGAYGFSAMVKTCNDFFSKRTWIRKKFMTEQESKEEEANSIFRSECRKVGEDLLNTQIPAVWANLILPRHFDPTSGEMASWSSIEDIISVNSMDGNLRYLREVDYDSLAEAITNMLGRDMAAWGALLDNFHVIMMKSIFPENFRAVQRYINKYKRNLDYRKVASAMFKGLRTAKDGSVFISDKGYLKEKSNESMQFLLAYLLKALVQHERKRYAGMDVYSDRYLSFGDTQPLAELKARINVYRRLVAAMPFVADSSRLEDDLYHILVCLGLGKVYPNNDEGLSSPERSTMIEIMVRWANHRLNPKDKGPEIAAEALLRYLDSTGDFNYGISLTTLDGSAATQKTKHIAMTCSPIVVNRFLEGSRNYFLYRNDNGMSWIRGIYKLAPDGLSCQKTIDVKGTRSISENTVVDDYLESELESGEVYTISLKNVGIEQKSGQDATIEYVFSPYVKGIDSSLKGTTRPDLLVRMVSSAGEVKLATLTGGESVSVPTCSGCSFTVYKRSGDQRPMDVDGEAVLSQGSEVVLDSGDSQISDWNLAGASVEIKLQHLGWETEEPAITDVNIDTRVKKEGMDDVKERASDKSDD